MSVNGELKDLSFSIDKDVQVRIITEKDKDQIKGDLIFNITNPDMTEQIFKHIEFDEELGYLSLKKTLYLAQEQCKIFILYQKENYPMQKLLG